VRVLFLTDRVSVRGGADLHLLQLIRWALDAGHRVIVAAGRFDDEAAVPAAAQTARIRGLASAVESSSRLGGLGDLLGALDVVHVQNVMNPRVLRTVAATGRAIATVQDHRVFCPGMGKSLPDGEPCRVVMGEEACARCLPDAEYRRHVLHLTNQRRQALQDMRLVVLSRWMGAQLAEVGLGGAEVIPPWVALGPVRHHPRRGFLLGGRLVAHKGVLDGWAAWRASGTGEPLTIAGEGPLADRLEGADHLGWVPVDRLRSELQRARALLFPSFWQEPFGMLGVEALAQGTPVIAADSGGTSEWTDVGCLRVPSGDVESMASAIARLDDDPEMARRLGQAGRSMVGRRFSRASIERRLTAIYRSVAEQDPRSPT